MKEESVDFKPQGSVANAVYDIAKPIAASLNLEIWDIKFLKEGKNWILRIFIDKPGGVDIQDCENFSRAIDKPLDIADPIDVSYCLEVCSPGIDRELSNDFHLKRFIGSDVKIRLIRPDAENKNVVFGELIDFGKDFIKIKVESELKVVLRKNISHINLNY